MDNGVRLAFGTDWSVAPLSPMWSIYAATTRATLDGKNPDGWVPEQKLKVAEAVEAYTMGSAYAEFQDKDKGSVTLGKLADFVVLSDDIFKIPLAFDQKRKSGSHVPGRQAGLWRAGIGFCVRSFHPECNEGSLLSAELLHRRRFRGRDSRAEPAATGANRRTPRPITVKQCRAKPSESAATYPDPAASNMLGF